jgi:acetoacetyl-CoA reductase
MARVAIVTGGTRGIGEAISLALKDMGMTVVANYAGNDQRAQEFTDRTGIKTVKFDVGNYDDAQAGVQKVADEVGPVDVLVNNAGITRDGTLLKMSKESWNEVIDTNLGGCFTMAKAVFPGMKERGWGRIVNIGSINGQAGQYGQVNYAAAKSGIHGFTKALAQEGARFGITVNAIAPGYIDTDMVAAVPADVLAKIVAKIPVGRLGQASEIARAVGFLVAEDAGFVTGSTLSINGGQHMYCRSEARTRPRRCATAHGPARPAGRRHAEPGRRLCRRRHGELEMNASQLFVLLFALLAIAIDLWAIVVVVRTPNVRYRLLWIIGSLVGLIGFSIDWTQPDDIYLMFGIMVPVVWVGILGSHVIVKTGFPIIAAVALAEVRRRKAE